MTMRLGYAVALAALLLHFRVGTAAEAIALERVQACVTETDPAQRLACYDAALGVGSDAGSSRAEATPSNPTSAPVTELPAPAVDERTAVERFGYYGEIAREEVDREAAAAPKLEMLQAHVTEIEWLPRGEFVLTLDNGQVWRQKTKQSIGPLRAGDQVTIRAGALGSFRLWGSSNRSTLVQRVK
jgi:hypothetical protein